MAVIKFIKGKLVNRFLNLPEIIDLLFNFMHKHHMISIKLDDIFNEHENINKFGKFMCWCNDGCIWANLLMVIIMVSKFKWLFVHPKLPPELNVFFVLLQVIHFFAAVFRMDLLLSESKDNLRSLKPFYDLKYYDKEHLKNINARMSHNEIDIRLNKSNYKKLSILSGAIHLLFIKQSIPFAMLSFLVVMTMICLITKSLIWMMAMPFFMYTSYNICLGCFVAGTFFYIILSYYRMLFSQINLEIKQISKSSLRKSLNRLPHLIHEHRKISYEIHKMNLALRRSLGALFITGSFGEMLSLYIFINVNHSYIVLLDGFIMFTFVIACLGISTLFSLQVNSAQKSSKFIYSILIKHNNLGRKTKWKVIKQITF